VETPGVSDNQQASGGRCLDVAELELGRGENCIALCTGTTVPVLTQCERRHRVMLSFSQLPKVSERAGSMTR